MPSWATIYLTLVEKVCAAHIAMLSGGQVSFQIPSAIDFVGVAIASD